jgi:hypothetical protein
LQAGQREIGEFLGAPGLAGHRHEHQRGGLAKAQCFAHGGMTEDRGRVVQVRREVEATDLARLGARGRSLPITPPRFHTKTGTGRPLCNRKSAHGTRLQP